MPDSYGMNFMSQIYKWANVLKDVLLYSYTMYDVAEVHPPRRAIRFGYDSIMHDLEYVERFDQNEPARKRVSVVL